MTSSNNFTSKENSYSDEVLQLVTFNIGEEEFAVDILNIQGINRMVEITKVPNAPAYVEGIINLRGKVIPIVDLRRRLGMKPKKYDKLTRFIVIEINSQVLGFIVDSVNEVLRIPRKTTEPPPQMVSGIDSDYITAVGKLDGRLIILLDIQKVLTHQEKEELVNLNLDQEM